MTINRVHHKMYFLYFIEFTFIIIYVYSRFKSDYDSFENNIMGNDSGFQLFDAPLASTEMPENKCDQSSGMYMVLVKSDGGGGVYECVNMYPMIFDNRGRVHDHVCKNGNINMSGVAGNLSIDGDFCVCDKLGFTKIFIYNAPICVRNVNMYT